jgi:hypothetical protein
MQTPAMVHCHGGGFLLKRYISAPDSRLSGRLSDVETVMVSTQCKTPLWLNARLGVFY